MNWLEFLKTKNSGLVSWHGFSGQRLRADGAWQMEGEIYGSGAIGCDEAGQRLMIVAVASGY